MITRVETESPARLSRNRDKRGNVKLTHRKDMEYLAKLWRKSVKILLPDADEYEAPNPCYLERGLAGTLIDIIKGR